METKNLLVVLQTYADSNALDGKTRVGNLKKEEISKRCALSLVNSLNYLQAKEKTLHISLKVFDDGSNLEYIKILKTILEKSNFQYSLSILDKVGIMNSISCCYEYAKENVKDMVYFVQDDFLHEETSIFYMLKNYELFRRNLGREMTLTGNHSTRFTNRPQNVRVPCRVVEGVDQYWRTTWASQFTMMTSYKLFLNNYDLFEKFGEVEYDEYCEDKSINLLYIERGFYDFCPIQSLVLSIDSEWELPPFCTWQILWNQYDLKKFEII